jgi:hypothetical protein
LHHQCGFGDTETTAAVFLWDGNAKVPGIGDSLIEIPGKLAAVITVAPVFIRKT